MSISGSKISLGQQSSKRQLDIRRGRQYSLLVESGPLRVLGGQANGIGSAS